MEDELNLIPLPGLPESDPEAEMEVRERRNSEASNLSLVSKDSFPEMELSKEKRDGSYSPFSDSDLDRLEEGEIIPPAAKNGSAGGGEGSSGGGKRSGTSGIGKKSSDRRNKSSASRNGRKRNSGSNRSSRGELARYDVRNLIKEKKNKKSSSSRNLRRSSRSRSSRSPSPKRRIRSRSPAPPSSKKKRKNRGSPPRSRSRNNNRRSSPIIISSSSKRSNRRKRRSASVEEIPEPRPRKKNSLTGITRKFDASATPTKKKRGMDDIIIKSHLSSVVSKKEVFTSGDKIMISVNFKTKSPPKPLNDDKAVVIDVMSSPYQVIEPSPPAIIDVFSDEDVVLDEEMVKTPSPIIPTSSTDLPSSTTVNNTEIINVETHRGPCTPPIEDNEESIDVMKGPQTPSDYDPCNPTQSPSDGEGEPGDLLTNGASVNLLKNWAMTDIEQQQQNNSINTNNNSTSEIPFMESMDNNSKKKDSTNASGDNANLSDLAIDMDMVDSPFSPQSSDMSDIFEPPLNTPLTNKLLQKKSRSKKVSSSSFKKRSGTGNIKKPNSKPVQMKLIDDKLRIVDDVPTSAVEMAVKEKFLKKVQRQERIVDEIKMVLKPLYNKKKIDKESYKEILRKCVPKICHSKNGDINPMKIQKLVNGYVKKYKYHNKKQQKQIINNSALSTSRT